MKFALRCFAAAAASMVALSAQAAWKDGTYAGQGAGNEGPVAVEVVVQNGAISAVRVTKHTDTPMIIQGAEKKLAKRIVKKNGLDGVDAVSGATNSSRGILEAVGNALKSAQ